MRKCSHYWLIEEQGRPTSWGVCCLCGKKQEFQNSADTTHEDFIHFKRDKDWQERLHLAYAIAGGKYQKRGEQYHDGTVD